MTQRLRRYLDEELGECRDEDVERRIEELSTLEATLGTAQAEAELDVLSALANQTRYTLSASSWQRTKNCASVS